MIDELTRTDEKNLADRFDAEVEEDGLEILYYFGERIYFRPLDQPDLPVLRTWMKNPHAWASTLGHDLSTTEEVDWTAWLENISSEHVFGVVLKDQDRLIGAVRLHVHRPLARSAELTLILGDPGHLNEGYGAEAILLAQRYAFREMNLNRVEVGVNSDHWRAIRLFQMTGFVHEGCLHQAINRNGRFVNEYRFAILRENWGSLLPAVA